MCSGQNKKEQIIIDAHMHLPVYEGAVLLEEKKEKLLQKLKQNKIAKCVVISDSTLESEIGSMDDCAELFAHTNQVSVVGGISPFIAFAQQFLKLKDYIAQKKLVGIKLFPGFEEYNLSDNSLQPIYEFAENANIPVLFHSGWENSQYAAWEDAAKVLEQYPKLKLVCCHCFYPKISDCLKLTSYPNMFFELSSVADDLSVFDRIKKDIVNLIKTAPDRVIFGSDYGSCNLEQHIQAIAELELDADISDKVFYQNAMKLYQLKEEEL